MLAHIDPMGKIVCGTVASLYQLRIISYAHGSFVFPARDGECFTRTTRCPADLHLEQFVKDEQISEELLAFGEGLRMWFKPTSVAAILRRSQGREALY